MKILYVDDKDEIRILLERYLTSWGYDAIGAPDGETGWRLFQEQRPDIVITDWIMPDLDGPSLCRRIREAALPEYTYLIMLTVRKDDVVSGMEAGADDFIGKPFNKEELKVRLKAAERIITLERNLEQTNRILKDKNSRLEESEGRLRTMAHFDKLTGLPNRVLFFDRLERAVIESKRKRQSFGLLYVDLDDFKMVNDSLGHEAGDKLLKEVAGRMSECVRTSDTVARVGGDEFCIIIGGVTYNNDAAVVAGKIMDALVQPFTINDTVFRIGASFGIVLYPDDAETAELLVSRSDKAMYEAKKAGKGTWRCWNQSDSRGTGE